MLSWRLFKFCPETYFNQYIVDVYELLVSEDYTEEYYICYLNELEAD